MSKIICGYDIRPVRGSELHLLVGHVLDLETLTVSTAIRMADRDSSNLENWVKDRQSKFGSEIAVEAGKRINWKLSGSETTGKVRGHSVTVDARFGVRAWVWMEMNGDRGAPVNVPVLIAEEKPEDVEIEDESVNEVIQNLVGGTMEYLMDTYPLRSIWPVRREWHGRYIPDLVPPAADEPALDSGSSEELRA